MTKDEIRSLFMNFFRDRGHAVLPNTSLIPDDDTVLFTIAGVQQVQPFFLGLAKPPANRLVNVQRCVRTGDIEEVGDSSHLTFFEMMGNWSIGDYFKREAVAWSWELCAQIGFEPDRIWASVYEGESGKDDETYRLWQDIGIPEERIVWLGDKDNWWAPGDTGPCGPDTELFYDRGEDFGCGEPGCAPGCSCERFLEFWNNVFTQYNRKTDGALELLDAKNVDTGAGLERWCMLVQGKESVYETDCFWPLIEALMGAASVDYGADAQTDRALRIIADHGRALTLMLFDGILPSADGRGSVLRRLLRRAVMNGRRLGLTQPFLADVVVPSVVDMMSLGYPDLAQRAQYIAELAGSEELLFLSTIERGIVHAEELLTQSEDRGVVDGAEAFNLLQSHGFPLQLTVDLAGDRGLDIDMDGYRDAEERHRRDSSSSDAFAAAGRNNQAYSQIAQRMDGPTVFLGYDHLNSEARVTGIIYEEISVASALQGQTVEIILDHSPFYAASGGQIGDVGELTKSDTHIRVVDTHRPKGTGLVVHTCTVDNGSIAVGDIVSARVDSSRHQATARHHSATHLTHRALQTILGAGVHQEGSVVEPTRFTFDFNHGCALTVSELAAIEALVNGNIRDDVPVVTAVMPFAEAVETGAMALFTEKYGDTVRVVEMGQSRELCGGTHVARTGEIGSFFILGESSVSAGVRRITCVAGDAGYTWAREHLNNERDIARVVEASPEQTLAKVTSMRAHTRILEKHVADLRQEIARLKVQSHAGGTQSIEVRQAAWGTWIAEQVDAQSIDDLKDQSDALKSQHAPDCVIVLGAVLDDETMFTAAATKGLDGKGIRAGDIIRAIAGATNGKGGGSSTWAQATASQPDSLDAGLTAARNLLDRAVVVIS